MFFKRSAPDPGNPDSAVRVRIAAFYFTLMTNSAVATPYLGLWLSQQGLTSQEIGIANALPMFTVMVLNMLAGRMADLSGDWRKTIRIGTALGFVPPLFLFFFNGNYALLLIWTLVIVPTNLIVPVTDAASVASSGRHGEAYSRIRVWGTIGYMAATLASGLAVERFGIAAFPYLILAVAALRVVMAMLLPPLHPPVNEMKSGAPDERRQEIGKQLFEMTRPWFLLTLIGGGLLNAAHTLQNSFGAIFWHDAGLTAGQIAILWAVATAAEIVIMFSFKGLAGRYPARVLLLAAGVISVVRWAGLAMSPPFPFLLLLQLLHFATFGLTYLATVAFIANRARQSAAASAQSLLSIIRQSTSVVALLAFGYFVGQMGIVSYHLAAGLSLIGVAAICISLKLMPSSAAGRLS